MVKKKAIAAIDQVMDDLAREELSSSVASSSLILEEFTSQGVLNSPVPVLDPSDSPAKPDNLSESLIRFKPIRQPESSISVKKKSKALENKSKQSGLLLASKLGKPSSSKLGKMNVNKTREVPNSHIPIILNQSENLRIAQERNIDLEKEIERLRQENEKLFAIEDNFKQLDILRDKYNHLQQIYEDNKDKFSEEHKILSSTIRNQKAKIEELKEKNNNLQGRLSSNIQQIRVRERELENRLELVKLDSQTLTREKDRYILDLKRQLDRLKMDLDRQKDRYNEVRKDLDHFRSQSRRALRSLNMSLDILRGEHLSQDEESKK